MSIENLSERICASADAELRARVEQAAQVLFAFIQYAGEVPLFAQTFETLQTVNVRWITAWRSIKELAFETLKDQNRKEKLTAHIAKVDGFDGQIEKLRAEIAELRDSIPN